MACVCARAHTHAREDTSGFSVVEREYHNLCQLCLEARSPSDE